jgi:hypothetical protein
MSCYVDKLQVWPNPKNSRVRRVGERHGHQWCHLWADTLEELHAIAKRVGMKPEWFQNDGRLPHYDLVPPRRAEAVALGAIEYDLADWFRGKRPAPVGQQALQLEAAP